MAAEENLNHGNLLNSLPTACCNPIGLIVFSICVWSWCSPYRKNGGPTGDTWGVHLGLRNWWWAAEWSIPLSQCRVGYSCCTSIQPSSHFQYLNILFILKNGPLCKLQQWKGRGDRSSISRGRISRGRMWGRNISSCMVLVEERLSERDVGGWTEATQLCHSTAVGSGVYPGLFSAVGPGESWWDSRGGLQKDLIKCSLSRWVSGPWQIGLKP